MEQASKRSGDAASALGCQTRCACRGAAAAAPSRLPGCIEYCRAASAASLGCRHDALFRFCATGKRSDHVTGSRTGMPGRVGTGMAAARAAHVLPPLLPSAAPQPCSHAAATQAHLQTRRTAPPAAGGRRYHRPGGAQYPPSFAPARCAPLAAWLSGTHSCRGRGRGVLGGERGAWEGNRGE